MKPSPHALLILMLSLASPVFAQSAAHDHSAPNPSAAADPQKAFDTLKGLAGSWVGQTSSVPPVPAAEGKLVQLVLRVTSLGHAMVHEMSITGRPDHPVTLLYLDGDRLTLTHYCDAGNRPRMAGKVSPDGKTLEFDFVDLSGSDENGHMHHVVFTLIDENHHTEDWTWLAPGNPPIRAHFDLQRTSFEGRPAR